MTISRTGPNIMKTINVLKILNILVSACSAIYLSYNDYAFTVRAIHNQSDTFSKEYITHGGNVFITNSEYYNSIIAWFLIGLTIFVQLAINIFEKKRT